MAGAATTKFGYDGLDALAEANGAGTILRRYAPGDALGAPVVWYEGSGTADRRFLATDERGSVIAVSDASGNLLAANSYDEYGQPRSGNLGRFQYTGQLWLPETATYHFAFRDYLPAHGVFAQSDPVGYAAGANIYSYVLGDPVNMVDPLGLECAPGFVRVGGGTSFDPNDPNGPVFIDSGTCVNWDFLTRTLPGVTIKPGRDVNLIGKLGKEQPSQPERPQQCAAATAEVREYEENLTTVANVIEGAAAIVAFTGAEPIALTLEVGAGVLMVMKMRSQLDRGDRAGAYTTLGTSMLGAAIGSINRIVPVGGTGQENFNAGVAAVLGNVYGEGLEKALDCE